MLSDFKTYTNKGCKIAAQKKCFWANLALLSRIFFGIGVSYSSQRCFAPTFQSPMCKVFRLSESLGKSKGKKGSQIKKLLLTKGVISPSKYIYFFPGKFGLTEEDLFGIGVSHSSYRSFAPTSQGLMCKVLKFLESLGKSNGKV